MPEYHLVSHHLCPYVQRVVITLVEKGLPFERTYVDLSDKPDWLVRLSPLSKTPVLQVDDEVLFESAVICDYLDEVAPPRLHPEEPLVRAHSRAWVEFASATLDEIGRFYSAPDGEALESRRRALAAKFERLESQVGDGPFFAGERFGMVDAAFGPVFRYFDVFDTIHDFAIFERTPRARRWRAALAARPSVRDAAVADYRERLRVFLLGKDSALAALMNGRDVAAAGASLPVGR